jgi:hypothetical protein
MAMASPRERFQIGYDSRPIETIARENSRSLPEERNDPSHGTSAIFSGGCCRNKHQRRAGCCAADTRKYGSPD